jgi:glycosyltransferase involved in cell wall biosynthesis
MAKVIQIQRYKADPNGFGGSHRIYQNHQDLISIAGELEVDVVEYSYLPSRSPGLSNKYRALIMEKMNCLLNGIKFKFNPEELSRSLVFDQIKNVNPFGTFPLEVYEQHINVHGKPKVCVLDYPSLIEIARYNDSQGIVNIYCPQNLESISTIVQRTGNYKVAYKLALRWIVEQEMLSLCQERLMISPLEVEFVRGLGLSAGEYPYLPVGEVRSGLMGIRPERKRENIEPGLLIMFGTVKQSSTGAGFRWFLDHVKSYGLPKGMHVVVGGIGAEQLVAEYGTVENVELKGWVSQGDLEDLMIKSSAVIVPQFSGFGTPTRVSEMACAGIPILTTSHMNSAMKVPPGVTIVSENWNDWVSALQTITKNPLSNTLNEYENWEKGFENPFRALLANYCS